MEINIRDFIEKYKTFYKSLDLRALLFKEENGWILLYCIIRASLKDVNETKTYHTKKKEDLLLSSPEDIQLIFESKKNADLMLILAEIFVGSITFNGTRAQIIPKKIDIDKFALKSNLNFPDHDEFGEYVGEILFDDATVSPLKYLKDKGIAPIGFGLDELNDLQSVFGSKMNNAINMKFIFPIPCKILSFRYAQNLSYEILLHRKLYDESTFTVQLTVNGSIVKKWVDKPRKVSEDNGLVVISQAFNISEYQDFDSIKLSVDNPSLGTICFRTLTPNSEIIEFDDNLVNDIADYGTKNKEETKDKFLEYLLENGLIYHSSTDSFKINNYRQTIIFPNDRNDLICSANGEHFYTELLKEINFTWRLGLFISVLILCRKYIENLVIDILRIKYPQSMPGGLELYFDVNRSRFNDFSILIDNLDLKKADFGPDLSSVDKFLALVKPFKDHANSTAHSIIESPDENQITKLRIQEMISLLEKVKSNI